MDSFTRLLLLGLSRGKITDQESMTEIISSEPIATCLVLILLGLASILVIRYIVMKDGH
jgi:hypothetical protein